MLAWSVVLWAPLKAIKCSHVSQIPKSFSQACTCITPAENLYFVKNIIDVDQSQYCVVSITNRRPIIVDFVFCFSWLHRCDLQAFISCLSSWAVPSRGNHQYCLWRPVLCCGNLLRICGTSGSIPKSPSAQVSISLFTRYWKNWTKISFFKN